MKVKHRKNTKEAIMDYRLSLASTAGVDDDVIIIRPVRKMVVTKVRRMLNFCNSPMDLTCSSSNLFSSS
jgi:hypothetical protein